MKLTELITLLKAGYTKKEIEALAAAEKEPEPAADPEPVQTQGTPTEPEEKPAAPEPEEPEPDYKTMYEQTKAALDRAQAANTRTPAKKDEPEDLQSVIDAIIK